MIKFFRKIRQRLLSENKFTRYMIYAFGEIFLVVIGILIALSINNANDDRKERIELNNYLLKISNDVNRDIEQVAFLKIRRDSVRSKAIRAFNLLQKKDFSDLFTIKEGDDCFYEFYFIPNKSGFDAMKTSPYLGKINNTKLDSLLTGYYAQVDLIENRELGYNNFMEEMEADLKKNIDIIPNQIINSLNWSNVVFDIDTSDIAWKDNLYKEILPMVKNNAFKAAVSRAVGDNTYIGRYADLVDLGESLVDEIAITIYDK